MNIFKRAYIALVKARTRQAMEALSDRTLADIGVKRSEIAAYVDKNIRS